MKNDFDPKTGEVNEQIKGVRSFYKRRRTPDEIAAAAKIKEERAAARAAEIETFRALAPACETSDDAPVRWCKPNRMGGEPSGILLTKERLSGRALSGSRLVIAARAYDGAGPSGGEPREYATAFVTFHDHLGFEYRTQGTALYRDELRDVAAALLHYADTLDAEDKKAP